MTPLRILLAHDGSPGADIAAEFVRAVAWPEGTVVRLIAVAAVYTPIVDTLPDTEEDASVRAALERMLDHVATTLPALPVTRTVARGRPADVIVAEAAAWRADVVVTGSRGHGPIATALLGSAAAEVVDRAPCPVLVARSASVGPVLLAEDGSAGAATARAMLLRASALAAGGVRVLSVVHVPAAARSGISFTVRELERAERARDLESARDEHSRMARLTAAVLRAAGLDATAATREGDPAHEILEDARASGARLIALGSRGRTGLRRILLGSVARNVLLHAQASVLIARENAHRDLSQHTANANG